MPISGHGSYGLLMSIIDGAIGGPGSVPRLKAGMVVVRLSVACGGQRMCGLFHGARVND